ncbi:MAG: hypothetical protein KDD53_01060 [Bdellovibrionales bacterium]|nr:hypothetical protein [Bdellovibrionales bacterium]
MIELRNLLDKREISTKSRDTAVYSLVSLLPLSNAESTLPLNISLICDSAVFASTERDSSPSQKLYSLLHEFLNGMPKRSRFSLVLVGDSAGVLLASKPTSEHLEKLASIGSGFESSRVINCGSDELSREILLEALQLGQEQVQQSATAHQMNRLIFLSKRPVKFENDEQAEELLSFAYSLRNETPGNMAFSGLITYGVGGLVNSNLLIDLSQESSSWCRSVSDTDQFLALAKMDLLRLSRLSIMNVQAGIMLSQGVELRRAYMVGRGIFEFLLDEELAKEETNRPRELSLMLGDIESNVVSGVLLELIAPRRSAGKVRLAQVTVSAYVPGVGTDTESVDVVVNYKAEPGIQTNPPPVNRMMSQCAGLRIVEQGEYAFLKGDRARTKVLLENARKIFSSVGERKISQLLVELVEKIDNENVDAEQFLKESFFNLRSSIRDLGLQVR